MKIDRRSFILQLGMGTAAFAGGDLLPTTALAARAPSNRLSRSEPETQGVASSGILAFVEAVEKSRLPLHSFMLVRHGHVVAEGWWVPYAPGVKHTLYSLTKNFTATAVAMAVAEGRLRLEDKVVSFLEKDLPAKVSPNLAAMRVQDLLMMAAGHAQESLFAGGNPPPEGNWVGAVLAQPVEFPPGTHYTYSNGAMLLLSAIIQKVTRQTLHAYLKPRLFEPLGIQGEDWEIYPQGINPGGWGLRLKTEDVARFGQLYLQKGVWNGQRLLSEAWTEEATRLHIQNAPGKDKEKERVSDSAQGYGYTFWRFGHDAYGGVGALCQLCIVMPKEDAVLAITAEVGQFQALFDTIWGHLLPAIRGVGRSSDDKARTELKKKLASLSLPLPSGQTTSSVAKSVSGKSWSIAENAFGVRRVSLWFEGNSCVFTMQDAAGEHRVTCGIGGWMEGKGDLSAVALHIVTASAPAVTRVAGSGAWSDENTFVMYWQFIETAHYISVTCRFDGDQLRAEFKRSVSILNPTLYKERLPILMGKLQR